MDFRCSVRVGDNWRHKTEIPTHGFSPIFEPSIITYYSVIESNNTVDRLCCLFMVNEDLVHFDFHCLFVVADRGSIVMFKATNAQNISTPRLQLLNNVDIPYLKMSHHWKTNDHTDNELTQDEALFSI